MEFIKSKTDFLIKINSRKKDSKRLFSFYTELKDKGKINISESSLSSIEQCGDFLEIVSDKEFANRRLLKYYGCNNRFCPICGKNLSKKQAILTQVMLNYLKSEKNREFLFLTLTVRNVTKEDLKDTLIRMVKSCDKLFKRKELIFVKGFIRKLEITYNKDFNSPNFGTYHPHYHFLISVNKSYFTSRYYLTRNRLLELWRKSYKDDLITQIDIKKITCDSDSSFDKSILELTKYFSKSSDCFYSLEVFETFYKALKGRNLLAYSKDFRIARDLLKKNDSDIIKYFKNDYIDWYYYSTYKWQFLKDGEYSEDEFVISSLPGEKQAYILEKLVGQQKFERIIQEVYFNNSVENDLSIYEEIELKDYKKKSSIINKLSREEVIDILENNQVNLFEKK